MRSQSHDLSDNEEGRTGANARRNTKQAASEGTDGAIGKSNAKRRKERPANQKRALQGMASLPTWYHWDFIWAYVRGKFWPDIQVVPP